jgi:hypothetical protein
MIVMAAACTQYTVRCQPEVDPADCEPAARAAVASAPLGLGVVVEAEVCSIGLATLCQVHERPADVVLVLNDGRIIGVAVSRGPDGGIEATAYWDESGRVDR